MRACQCQLSVCPNSKTFLPIDVLRVLTTRQQWTCSVFFLLSGHFSSNSGSVKSVLLSIVAATTQGPKPRGSFEWLRNVQKLQPSHCVVYIKIYMTWRDPLPCAQMWAQMMNHDESVEMGPVTGGIFNDCKRDSIAAGQRQRFNFWQSNCILRLNDFLSETCRQVFRLLIGCFFFKLVAPFPAFSLISPAMPLKNSVVQCQKSTWHLTGLHAIRYYSMHAFKCSNQAHNWNHFESPDLRWTMSGSQLLKRMNMEVSQQSCGMQYMQKPTIWNFSEVS